MAACYLHMTITPTLYWCLTQKRWCSDYGLKRIKSTPLCLNIDTMQLHPKC